MTMCGYAAIVPGGDSKVPILACRSASCQESVIWAKTPAGKNMPLDATPTPDGKYVVFFGDPVTCEPFKITGIGHGDRLRFTPHWATCSRSASWKRKKAS